MGSSQSPSVKGQRREELFLTFFLFSSNIMCFSFLLFSSLGSGDLYLTSRISLTRFSCGNFIFTWFRVILFLRRNLSESISRLQKESRPTLSASFSDTYFFRGENSKCSGLTQKLTFWWILFLLFPISLRFLKEYLSFFGDSERLSVLFLISLMNCWILMCYLFIGCIFLFSGKSELHIYVELRAWLIVMCLFLA